MVYNWRLTQAPYSSFLPRRPVLEGRHEGESTGNETATFEMPLTERAGASQGMFGGGGGRRAQGWWDLRTVLLLCLVPRDKAILWGDACVYHAWSFLCKNLHKKEKVQSLSSPFHFFFLFTCPQMKEPHNFHGSKEEKWGPRFTKWRKVYQGALSWVKII